VLETDEDEKEEIKKTPVKLQEKRDARRKGGSDYACLEAKRGRTRGGEEISWSGNKNSSWAVGEWGKKWGGRVFRIEIRRPSHPQKKQYN